MDPRNFLNEVRIFQFESLSYSESYTKTGIEKILYGTEFYNKQVDYLDAKGNQIFLNEKYSDLILKAGEISLASPYHLASRIKQEVGPFLTHNSISGIVEGYKGLYNFYNIGATSSSEPMGAIKNGLRYAYDGNGASEETKNKFLIPWDSKEKAITGGAIFISSSYINVGQNCLYLQKFDVNDEKSGELFWHQYMTNVLAPYSESKSIYNGYLKSELLNTSIDFIIPIFKNMPEIPKDSPDINPEDYILDNSKVYAEVDTYLNIRSGPGSNYEILTKVNKETIFYRINKGVQKGELWDKVRLENGMIGYAFQSYIKPYKEITDLLIDSKEKKLNVGDIDKIKVYVFPEDANNKNISFQSSNSDVVTVDNLGNLKAISEGEAEILVQTEDGRIQKKVVVYVREKNDVIEILFPEEWVVINQVITGIDFTKNSVLDLREKIQTEYTVHFYNNKNELLSETDLVGTGTKIEITNNENTINKYEIIIYGDVNGDGKINSIDLLVLQRHILEIEMFEGVFLKASNILKNDKKPSSIDLLLIQRHILGLKHIEQ